MHTGLALAALLSPQQKDYLLVFVNWCEEKHSQNKRDASHRKGNAQKREMKQIKRDTVSSIQLFIGAVTDSDIVEVWKTEAFRLNLCLCVVVAVLAGQMGADIIKKAS